MSFYSYLKYKSLESVRRSERFYIDWYNKLARLKDILIIFRNYQEY